MLTRRIGQILSRNHLAVEVQADRQYHNDSGKIAWIMSAHISNSIKILSHSLQFLWDRWYKNIGLLRFVYFIVVFWNFFLKIGSELEVINKIEKVINGFVGILKTTRNVFQCFCNVCKIPFCSIFFKKISRNYLIKFYENFQKKTQFFPVN